MPKPVAAVWQTVLFTVVPGAFLRTGEKGPLISGEGEFWKGPVHLASGTEPVGGVEKP